MSLLKTLQEQVHIGFSGRVNLLIGNEKRYAGHVLMDGGVVVDCRYEGATGKPALLMAVSYDTFNSSLSKVVEPEIITNDMKMITLSVDEFAAEAKEYLRKSIRLHKIGLPKGVAFSVKREAIFEDDLELLQDEYNLATLLWDFKSFSDIIEDTDMEEERVSIALFGLREKKVLRVKKGSVE